MRGLMTKSGNKVSEIESFKYLESFVQKNRCFDKGVKYRIKYGRIKGIEALGVLYDKRISMGQRENET